MNSISGILSDSGPKAQAGNVRAAVFFNGECDLPDDFFRVNSLYDDFDFFCADGGADLAARFDIIPLLILGDMDSISETSRRRYEKTSRMIVFNSDKEKSDGELMLEYLKNEGYREIHLFAATGGRLDQTLFNIQLLCNYAQAKIITRSEEIFYLPPGSLIENRRNCPASIIPVTPIVKKVTTSGLKYEIRNKDLKFASTLTLSNVIISDTAKFEYSDGKLLMVINYSRLSENTPRNSRLKLIKGKKR